MCCTGLGEQACLAMKPGEMSGFVFQESVKIWAIFFQMASRIGHRLGIHYCHGVIDSSLPMHPVSSLAGAQKLVVVCMELLFSTFLSLIYVEEVDCPRTKPRGCMNHSALLVPSAF
uniref:Uncharacterized protein n=1 Tax=Micrurus lemniscatus lemniscatus TaxID=129467 RepID=A0A2D4IXK2_MICLE